MLLSGKSLVNLSECVLETALDQQSKLCNRYQQPVCRARKENGCRSSSPFFGSIALAAVLIEAGSDRRAFAHYPFHEMSDYTEKLKDPRWQRLRLEIFQRDKFACRFCYTDSETLHCHHLKYITGREPWDYPLDHLITLCAFCHDKETKTRKESIAKLIEVVTVKTPIPAHAVREIAYFLEESLQNELPDVAVRAIEWALLPGDDDQSLVSRFTNSPRWLENRI